MFSVIEIIVSAKPKPNYVSPEEYLAMEKESLEKHKYSDGKIFLDKVHK